MRTLGIITLLCLTFWSCEITYKLNDVDVGEAETVNIMTFRNSTSLAPPTLAQVFTEDLQELFLAQTKLDLINKEADLTYEGTITGYSVKPIGIQGNDVSAQNRLTITVQVSFKDALRPEKNFESSFTRFADFPSSQTLSAVEDQLIEEVNEQLTQDIFNRSLSTW